MYNTLIHHIIFTSIVTWFLYYIASFCHCFQRVDMMKYEAFILHENDSLINFNWRLITLQYCGGFCHTLTYIHTLTWINHRYTCGPLENDFLNRVSFSSVSHSCLTLCNPMDCSTPGLPVRHQLLELTHTHVHRVGECHPTLSSLCQIILGWSKSSIRCFQNRC